MEIYGKVWQAAMACPKIYVYKEVSPHKLSEMNEYIEQLFHLHPSIISLVVTHNQIFLKYPKACDCLLRY
jgi:hypothetical protein